MLVALDFDGVIHNPDDRLPSYRMGRPVEGAVDAVAELIGQGHTVVVHTVRNDADGHVSKWLRYFGIRHHGVTNIKPNADVFVDDKAIRFTDWPNALETLNNTPQEK